VPPEKNVSASLLCGHDQPFSSASRPKERVVSATSLLQPVLSRAGYDATRSGCASTASSKRNGPAEDGGLRPRRMDHRLGRAESREPVPSHLERRDRRSGDYDRALSVSEINANIAADNAQVAAFGATAWMASWCGPAPSDTIGASPRCAERHRGGRWGSRSRSSKLFNPGNYIGTDDRAQSAGQRQHRDRRVQQREHDIVIGAGRQCDFGSQHAINIQRGGSTAP